MLTMRFKFGYTGIRVRDLDKAIQFFTSVLGMKLQGRIRAPLNKGEFANLLTPDEKHWLEINWYADDSPVAGPFKEGDELDHLGFEVDDFDGALHRLEDAGYPCHDRTSRRWRMESRILQSHRRDLARHLPHNEKENSRH